MVKGNLKAGSWIPGMRTEIQRDNDQDCKGDVAERMSSPGRA